MDPKKFLNFGFLTKGRDSKFPAFDFLKLSFLVAAMAAMMHYDPFGINHKIVDFLRLKFPVFIKEPRLLFYAYLYIGTFIAKAIAVFFILILLAAGKTDMEDNLGLKAPASSGWSELILPFIAFAIVVRTYYSANPLIPNLPTRFIFPEAMVAGNIIIILSVLFVAPVAEELIFRGYLFDVFKRGFGVIPSAVFTSALFALAHFPQLNFEILDIGIIFMLGLAFALLRHRTGSIIIPVFFHFLYNLTYVVVGIFYYLIIGY